MNQRYIGRACREIGPIAISTGSEEQDAATSQILIDQQRTTILQRQEHSHSWHRIGSFHGNIAIELPALQQRFLTRERGEGLMRTVHCTNGYRLLLLALRGLTECKRQQKRVRPVKHGIIAHRIDPVASEEEEAPPLDNKLIEALAYLGRERFDVAQRDHLVVTEALLFQTFPRYGFRIKQRPSQDTAWLQRLQQVKNFTVKQRGTRVSIHEQHMHWRYGTQSIIKAIVLSKPIPFQADLPPV